MMLKFWGRRPAPPLLHDRVRIDGLSARPELNGRRGTARSFDEKTGRYVVELEGVDAKKLSVRPSQL
eukprot:4095697-Prymnesium_polylepis.1